MKVAYFSPLPPSTSGIADYSALLLPALERLVEVEVVRPGRTRPVSGSDVALYHVGNDPDQHGWILDALRRRPGVVVLHDFVLHHLVAGTTIGRKDGHAYLAAMEREGGVPGRLLGWGVLEGRVPPLWEVRPHEFPLVDTVLDRATGVIVHSRYVEARVREHGYEGPVWRIPHPAWPAPELEPARVDGAPLLGCFGHVNENKRIPQLLRAFAALRERHPGARLLLVGSETPGFSLRHELPEGVLREPYVEEPRLWALLAACDAVVQLRSPTMGETSGGAIRALSLGKPLVVSDLGWFAELPDEVALKVAPGGEDEVPALTAALERLAEPRAAAEMGAAARAYVEREHDLGRVAEQYAAALEQAGGDGVVREKVLREVAEAAADVGLEPEALAPALAEAAIVSPNGHAVPGHVQVPGTGTWPPRTVSRAPMWLWLGMLYAVAAAVLLALGERLPSPWILVDELIYGDMARSFAATGHFLLRGDSAGYAPLYPLLISPVYKAIGPVHDVYQWIKVVNALLMPSAVFPAYLLARRVVKRPAAFVAAVLAVAVPAMAYVGTVMTENLFYPLFLWLALALVLALERPTLQRQLVLLGVCVVAFEARQQGFVFFAAALTAPLVLAWIERGRPRNLRAWAPLYGIAVAAGLAVVVYELARGQAVTSILGKYSRTSSGGYHWWQVVRWLFLHVAELDLYVWVLPFAALIVLVANARHLDARLRAFAAAAASISVWLVAEVAVFASRYSLRIEDRYTFYLAPLLVIALLAWIERGQPRPPRAAVVAAGLAAALPGMIPFLGLLNTTSTSDTLGLQPWWYVGDALAGRQSVGVVAVLVSIVLAAAFLWLPRRWAPLLPALVGLGFLFTWLPLQLWSYSFPQDSRNAYRLGNGHGSWIDDAVGRDARVAVLWSGGNRLAVWENEFWNRSVRAVYDLAKPLPGNLPSTPVAVDQGTGILRASNGEPIAEPYVLTTSNLRLRGTVVARDRAKRLLLYRVRVPARTTRTITGLYPEATNPWSNAHPVWTRYGCSGGTLSVTVFSDPVLFRGDTQTVRVSGTTTPVTLEVPSKTAGLTFRFPLTPRNGVCRVAFAISPSRVPGHGDTRRLGLHFAEIRYTAP